MYGEICGNKMFCEVSTAIFYWITVRIQDCNLGQKTGEKKTKTFLICNLTLKSDRH